MNANSRIITPHIVQPPLYTNGFQNQPPAYKSESQNVVIYPNVPSYANSNIPYPVLPQPIPQTWTILRS
jgi:hypothetical protein